METYNKFIEFQKFQEHDQKVRGDKNKENQGPRNESAALNQTNGKVVKDRKSPLKKIIKSPIMPAGASSDEEELIPYQRVRAIKPAEVLQPTSAFENQGSKKTKIQYKKKRSLEDNDFELEIDDQY